MVFRPFDPLTTALRAAVPSPLQGEFGRLRLPQRRPAGGEAVSHAAKRTPMSLPYSFEVSSGRPLKGGEGHAKHGEGVDVRTITPFAPMHPRRSFARAPPERGRGPCEAWRGGFSRPQAVARGFLTRQTAPTKDNPHPAAPSPARPLKSKEQTEAGEQSDMLCSPASFSVFGIPNGRMDARFSACRKKI